MNAIWPYLDDHLVATLADASRLGTWPTADTLAGVVDLLNACQPLNRRLRAGLLGKL